MGLTPLYAACQGGHFEAVRVLLENGAKVNHRNVKNGRTCLMEACLRPKGDMIIKELLRYGAKIDVKDYQGETARESAKDSNIKKLLDLANEPWHEENAVFFPLEFRQITLTFALIAKKQYENYLQRQKEVKKKVIFLKQKLQRIYIEAKVKYDEETKIAKDQISIFKKIDAFQIADTKYDQERARILCCLHDTWKYFLQAQQKTFLTKKIIFKIFGFCERHWFEHSIHNKHNDLAFSICMDHGSITCHNTYSSHSTYSTSTISSHSSLQKKTNKNKNKKKQMTIGKKLVVPTRLCPSPDELPLELIREWEICLQAIERCRSELKMTEANEKVDVKTGVARDLEGKSVAFLDITVVQAENLPLRSHHTQDVVRIEQKKKKKKKTHTHTHTPFVKH
jgi:hypothetical protein